MCLSYGSCPLSDDCHCSGGLLPHSPQGSTDDPEGGPRGGRAHVEGRSSLLLPEPHSFPSLSHAAQTPPYCRTSKRVHCQTTLKRESLWDGRRPHAHPFPCRLKSNHVTAAPLEAGFLPDPLSAARVQRYPQGSRGTGKEAALHPDRAFFNMAPSRSW